MADTAPVGKDEAIDLLRDALEHYDRLAPNTITAREALRMTAHLAPGTAPAGHAWLPLEPTEAMVHAAEDLPAPRMFGKVWRAMARAALASRPADVDDEGLPPLPEPLQRDDTEHDVDYFTAEQFRQGQRDAVAADRARRGDVEEPFYPQLFLNWNRSQESPPVAIGKEMGVARKAVELSRAAPSHTTKKDGA